MPKQTHVIDSDVPVRVTVEPADPPHPPPAAGQPWFRLFRSLVHSGVWAELTPAAAKVLIVLGECVNDRRRDEEGRWHAWPSVATIAGRSGCQRRAVQKALADLEARGLISRCRRRTARRGDYSNEYELHPPASEDAPEEAHEDAHGGASGATPAPASEPAPRRRGPVRPAGAARCARQSRTRTEPDTTADGPAAEALRAAGIEQPMLGRLVAGHDAEKLLLRVEDWRTRNKLGQRLGPAWLIASVRDGYDLHEATVAEREKAAKADAAADRRATLAAERAAADAESARLDAAAGAMLDAMSDDELAHWRGVVVGQFPALARHLRDADPRRDDRLRRLIQGKLVHLVG